MPLNAPLRALLLAALLATPAWAQEAAGPGVQAVVGLLNVLDRPAVAEASAGLEGDAPRQLAEALLGYLEREQIVAPDLLAPVAAQLDDATLERSVFILYLADLLNGGEALETREADVAEGELRVLRCGIEVPAGRLAPDADAYVLTNADVGSVVDQVVASYECLQGSLRDRYDDHTE